MVDIQAQVVIDRSRDDVARFAMDPSNDPTWIGGIAEATMLTDPPFGKGTKVRRVASFLGRRMEYTPEVVEYVPNTRLVMSTDTPFDMTISYEFEERGAATLARIRVQGGGGGFYKLAAPLLGRMVKRNVTRHLRALKRLLGARADQV